MDDVIQKLAEASTPDDVKRVLDECGYKLSEAPGDKPEKPEGEAAVEVEIGVESEPPPKKGRKSFKEALLGAADEVMGGD